MSPGWIDRLVQEESDKEVSEYVLMDAERINNSRENSRLESSTDSFDSIESYVCNRLICYNIKFEEDKVYFWLKKSMDFFAEHDAFELCYNIQKAINIIKEKESDVYNAPAELGEDGLPF